ncbi:biopolymer transporter ExbD [soil metagenome]
MALMKKKNRPSGEIPTSSMADIAFLLLVFFLVTTVFDEQKGLQIVLPEQQEIVEVSQKNILHLMIQPNGIVHVKRGESPQIEQVPAANIGAIWRQEFAGNVNLIAAVKTSPQAPLRFMVDVLDQLQAAQADKISLQILE